SAARAQPTQPWRRTAQSLTRGLPWAAWGGSAALSRRPRRPVECAWTGGEHYCAVEYDLHGPCVDATARRRVSRAGRGYRALVAVGVRAPELSWSLQLCAAGGHPAGWVSAVAHIGGKCVGENRGQAVGS